ncbi:hypothetical protein BSZ15_11900 [Bradyrhizobium canariense]|nr:hypothetical protein BSZ15_11900 [Bradyrhizobium canariense]
MARQFTREKPAPVLGPADERLTGRAVWGATIGNILEFSDFGTYSFFAIQIAGAPRSSGSVVQGDHPRTRHQKHSLIDAPRQSERTKLLRATIIAAIHHLAATPTRHPDCRALPIQIVALYHRAIRQDSQRHGYRSTSGMGQAGDPADGSGARGWRHRHRARRPELSTPSEHGIARQVRRG